MGSFAVRCAVSGLPIEFEDPRTPVRALLLVENPWAKMEPYGATAAPPWMPRTFPLRAVCDGSGGIEQVEEGLHRDIWLEALNEDLIERPADDRCPAICRGMSFDDLLANIADGRVFVRCVDRFAKSARALREALHALGAPETLMPVPETPDPRTSSDDGFPNQRPFPKEGPLAVSLALIREDVWQAMIRLSVAGGVARQRTSDVLPNGVGEQVVTLGAHADLIQEKGLNDPTFLEVAREFFYIRRIMALCGQEWLPSSGRGNPQSGMWQAQAAFRGAIANIARSVTTGKDHDIYD